jgi:hypothetical protein
MLDIEATFEKHKDKFLKNPDLQDHTSLRTDMCALILLDKLVPHKNCIIGCAEHDKIYLDVDLPALAKAAVEEDIITLIRLGVMFDEESNSLAMFI